MFLDANQCKLPYCKKICCLIKDIWIKIGKSDEDNKADINLNGLFDRMQIEYGDDFLIDSLGDSLQILMHSFNRSSCLEFMKGYNVYMNIKQIFTCECGKIFDCVDDSLNILVDVESNFIGDFEYLIRNQFYSKTYNLCSDRNCKVTKSKMRPNLNQLPEYFIIKLSWKTNIKVPIYNLIKETINLSRIFYSDSNDLYSLSAVTNEEDIYYNYKGSWYRNYNSFQSLNELKNYFIASDISIELLVYERTAESVNSGIGKILSIEKPPLYLNGSSKKLIDGSQYKFLGSWTCGNCNNINLDKFQVCEKCEEIKQGVNGWLCKRCKYFNQKSYMICEICNEDSKKIEELKSPQSASYARCPKCKSLCYDPKNCSNCTKKIDQIGYKTVGHMFRIAGSSANPSDRRSTSKPTPLLKATEIKCKNSNEHIGPFYCNACFERSDTSICKKCKNYSIFICLFCYKKIKCNVCGFTLQNEICMNCVEKKRPKSVYKKKTCSECKSTLNISEERNCKNCLSRVRALPCPKCNRFDLKIQYICDSCLNKKSKPSNIRF